MRFVITRTETRRMLIEAPSRNAALEYSNSDAFGNWCDQTSPDTQDTIEMAPTHPRAGGGVSPDRYVDEAGNEIEAPDA